MPWPNTAMPWPNNVPYGRSLPRFLAGWFHHATWCGPWPPGWRRGLAGSPMVPVALRARGLWLGQHKGHRDHHHEQHNDGRGVPCESQEELEVLPGFLEVLPDVTETGFQGLLTSFQAPQTDTKVQGVDGKCLPVVWRSWTAPLDLILWREQGGGDNEKGLAVALRWSADGMERSLHAGPPVAV